MLIRRDALDAIVAGRVDRAFRRWKRPAVKPGGRLRTHLGELAIDEVTPIDDAELTDAEARAAGHADLATGAARSARGRAPRWPPSPRSRVGGRPTSPPAKDATRPPSRPTSAS